MLVPGAPLVLRVRLLDLLEGALGLADLLEDVLDVGLQSLLERAELLVEGGLEPLGLVEGGLGLGVLLALALDRFGALGQILFRALARAARSLCRSDAAFSNSAAARAIASTSVASVGIRRSAAACRSWRVLASVSAIALSRVACVVSTSSRVLASSAAWRPAASAAFATGRVSGSSRRARRKSSCSGGGSFGPGGVPLLLGGGGRDAVVLFGQPRAAAVGPVGRADVLGDLLRPGADVDAVAELGLGGDEGLAGGRDGTGGAEDVVDAAGDRAGRNVRPGCHDVVSEGDGAEHGDDDVGRDVLLILGDEDVGEGLRAA